MNKADDLVRGEPGNVGHSYEATINVDPLRLVEKRQRHVDEQNGEVADEASEPRVLSSNDSPKIASRKNHIDCR